MAVGLLRPAADRRSGAAAEVGPALTVARQFLK